MNHIGAVILAAGGSSRLGYPKQLLQRRGQNIVQKLIQDVSPLVDELTVVTGASAEAVESVLADVRCVHNADWSKGMGGSIATGIAGLSAMATHALICLCDQVDIPKSHYAGLISTSRKQPDAIVASAYAGTIGVPVVFPRHHFDALTDLQGRRGGANAIIRQYPHQWVACEAAAFDLDEPRDVEKWQKKI